jgi:hypothetical protein
MYNDPETCLRLAREDAHAKAETMNKSVFAILEQHGFADFTVIYRFILGDKPIEQPEPVHNDNPPVWDLVVNDMCQRDRTGQARYGTRLQPFNGRDALRDAYEEMLDAAVYIRQALFERDGK